MGEDEGVRAGEYVIQAYLTNWPKKYESLLFVADNLRRQRVREGVRSIYTVYAMNGSCIYFILLVL